MKVLLNRALWIHSKPNKEKKHEHEKGCFFFLNYEANMKVFPLLVEMGPFHKAVTKVFLVTHACEVEVLRQYLLG